MTAWASRLFPEPLEPITATISPGSTVTLRSRMVRRFIRLIPRSYWVKEMDRFFTSSKCPSMSSPF